MSTLQIANSLTTDIDADNGFTNPFVPALVSKDTPITSNDILDFLTFGRSKLDQERKQPILCLDLERIREESENESGESMRDMKVWKNPVPLKELIKAIFLHLLTHGSDKEDISVTGEIIKIMVGDVTGVLFSEEGVNKYGGYWKASTLAQGGEEWLSYKNVRDFSRLIYSIWESYGKCRV